MSTRAIGTFEVKKWDEKPYSEVEAGPKLTRASVLKTLSGDVEGEATLEYLMVYHADGSATVYGLERVVGKLAGRSGSFVLEHRGNDDGQKATIGWTVVPGSGTGELCGLRGEGGFTAGRNEYPYSFGLDYEFQ